MPQRASAQQRFDWAAAQCNIHAIRPGMEVLAVSTKTGHGMDTYIELLESRLGAFKIPMTPLPL